MKKLMNRLMLSCTKATELAEKKINFKLNTIESIQLKMHTLMCSACRNYQKQSIFIDKALKKSIVTGNYKHVRLSDDYKNKIIRKLRKKNRNI
jgi:hypothetical protein